MMTALTATHLSTWTTDPAADEPEQVWIPQLRARVHRPHQNALVVAVQGDVDAATVQYLREVLWPRLSATVEALVVELTEVGFLGVTGLQLLHQAHLWVDERGVALGLVLAGGEPARAVHMAGLDVDLPCFATTEDALQHALDGWT